MTKTGLFKNIVKEEIEVQEKNIILLREEYNAYN
jgi:hypothetical protein